MRAGVLALFVVVACGAAPGQSPLPLPSPPTAALAKWKDFPAHAKPRPIIAFGDTVDHIQDKGFPTNDRKIAWSCSKFVFASGVTLSSARPTAATAGGTSYPATSSAQAYSELMAARAGGGNATDCARVQPFVIAAVRLGTAGFSTDRGSMTMSAWLFDVPEVNSYLGHSAVDPAAYWGGRLSTEGRGAHVSSDGLTLKVTVGNAEPGPCGFDYTAAVAESESAVAVAVKQIPHASPGAPVICPLAYRVSYISVSLKAPLGERVLVDEQGNAGTACPETGNC